MWHVWLFRSNNTPLQQPPLICADKAAAIAKAREQNAQTGGFAFICNSATGESLWEPDPPK